MATDNDRSHSRYRRLKRLFRQASEKRERDCWLCGQPIDYTLPSDHPDSFSLDHRFPWESHPHLRFDPANFEPSHRDCNLRRGKRSAPASLGVLSQEW